MEKNSALHRYRKKFRSAQLNIADCLRFLNLVIHSNLRTIVRALPDGQGHISAQQRVIRFAIAERDELWFERRLAGRIRRKTAITPRSDGIKREAAKAYAASLLTAGPDCGRPRIAARAAS